MKLSKDVRYSIERIIRAGETALVALDRFESDENLMTALEAGQAVADIGTSYNILSAVLEAEAVAAMERIQSRIAEAADDSGVVVPFPGKVH